MAVRSSLAIFCLAGFVLSSCGPGSHGTVPATIPGGSGGGPTVQEADVTFTFTFPKATSSAKRTAGGRTPAYLSSATKSVSVQVTDTKNAGTNADIYANVPAGLKAVQSVNFANLTGSPTTPGQCGTDPSNAGNYKCTAKYQMPIGINTVTIASWDANGATGNKLSQQIGNFTVTQGVANAFGVSLDANANAMVVNASVGYCAGSVTVTNGQGIPTVGTSPVNFNVAYTDPAGKTIVAPGLPSLQILGNDSAYHTTTGTINGTGGNVTFSINQSTQSFTLTATTSSVSGATVNVKAVPPSPDGLSYSQTLNFTFSSGPAPPPQFLAVIEEAVGSAQGSIDFYTFNPATNTFGTASPSSLTAQTPSGSPNNDPDVDFPQDMAWDSNGDLLIANGGGLGTSPDHGNFACIPAGAVTTGANAATVLTNGMDDPTFLALMSDDSVALGNNPAAASPHVQDFALSGTYAARSSYNITGFTSPAEGVTGVIPITPDASNPVGTFVTALTDGGPDTVANVVWERLGAIALNVNNSNMSDPFIAYDLVNKQIVVADGNTPGGASALQAYIQYLNADTGAVVQTQTLDDDGCFQGGATPYAGCPPQGTNTANGQSDSFAGGAAVSSSGYVAILMTTDIQNGQSIWIYDQTSGSRKTIGGPIPFSAYTTASGSTPYTYGGGSGQPAVVSAMRWITATQLMVSLRSQYNTAAQGIYVFDVSQPLAQMCTCYDAYGTQFPNSVKKVAFLNITAQMPYSFAYKP